MITANMFWENIKDWETYRLAVLIPEMGKKLIIPQGYDEKSEPLKAYVNQGRWTVKCECNDAEFAWDEGWFMCRSCFNGNHKHKYRKAVFPKDRKQIEKLLEIRPLQNRNWRDGETLAQLRAENKEHKGGLL